MKKRLVSLFLVLALCLAIPAAALAEKVYISSTGKGTLNLRKGPSTDYVVVGYVKHNAKVTVKDTDGDWSKVKVSSTGKTGWIKTMYIDGTTKDLGTGTKQVDSEVALPLRKGPGTSYEKIGTVHDGDKCKVLNTENDWCKITVNGQTGWIMTYHIVDSEDDEEVKPVSTSGKSYKVYHVTADSGLHVRKGPGTAYGIINVLGKGQGFRVIGSAGNWFKVRLFGTNQVGWLSKTYAAPKATGTVTAASLHVRKGAGTGYKILGSMKYGTSVTIDTVKGNWGHIVAGPVKGYASLTYLKF